MGEELLHLAIKLSGQRLVVRQNEGGAANILDDIGDGKGLATTSHTKQSLSSHTLLDAIRQLLNRFRLVACRNIF